MKKYLALLVLSSSFNTFVFAQEILDIEKFSNCELFQNKGDFDNEVRLQLVKDLEGELITVYFLKRGKKNIIKDKYVGKIDFTLINERERLNEENSVSVIVITQELPDGKMIAHFPHTDLSYFRLYRTECLEQYD